MEQLTFPIGPRKTICRSDLDAIEDALRAARNHALSYRYGGLQGLYDKCRAALDALERIRNAPQ